jgi:hypothetical protein
LRGRWFELDRHRGRAAFDGADRRLVFGVELDGHHQHQH